MYVGKNLHYFLMISVGVDAVLGNAGGGDQLCMVSVAIYVQFEIQSSQQNICSYGKRMTIFPVMPVVVNNYVWFP